MQSVNGTTEEKQITKTTNLEKHYFRSIDKNQAKNLGTLTKKSCKRCLTGKRYANLTICYLCHRGREKIKRELKVKARLLKKAKFKEKKANSPKVLKKNLDTILSLYVRRRASDSMGMATCITCGIRKHYKELQAGHYISRDNYSVRYDLRNIAVQCFKCNMKFGGCKGGNLVQYTKYLLNNYGADWLQKLIKDGEQIKQWTAEELKSEIEKFRELLKSV